jgi:Flp pilus assembly pilin Flp
MCTFLPRLIADERAAAANEYGFIAALVAVAAVNTMGPNLSTTLNTIAHKTLSTPVEGLIVSDTLFDFGDCRRTRRGSVVLVTNADHFAPVAVDCHDAPLPPGGRQLADNSAKQEPIRHWYVENFGIRPLGEVQLGGHPPMFPLSEGSAGAWTEILQVRP